MSKEILNAAIHDTWEGGASFSLSNRLFRLAWMASWFLLASWTPGPMHGWRRFVLRLFGTKIASTAGVYGSARIWNPANLEVGHAAFIGPGVTVYNMARITFGPYALASQGAYLCTGTHDIEDPNFQLVAKPIVLSTRAWVAAQAFVGPGVTLGEGAVLGARACAFRDLDPWMVYAGNPARPIKPRRVRGPGFRAFPRAR